MDFVDATHGWAVGASGSIWRYDGQTWQPEAQDLGVEATLRSVDMFTTTVGIEGWAVGDAGTFLHYVQNGTGSGTWRRYSLQDDGGQAPAVTQADFGAVAFAATGEGWAISRDDRCAQPGSGVHYAYFLRYIPGSGTLSGWTEPPDIQQNFCGAYDMYLSADGKRGWAVGNYYGGGSYGGTPEPTRMNLSIYYKDMGWAPLGAIGFKTHYGVSMIPDPSNLQEPWYGWIVGEPSAYARWPGMTAPKECGARTPPCWLTITEEPPTTLYGVQLLTKTDGWAVGIGGVVYRWDGHAWLLAYTSPAGRSLWRVTMTSSTDGWAVGDGGDILHYALR